MADVLEQVSAVSEQMVLYGLNKEELLLLQATVLVNAGECLLSFRWEIFWDETLNQFFDEFQIFTDHKKKTKKTWDHR